MTGGPAMSWPRSSGALVVHLVGVWICQSHLLACCARPTNPSRPARAPSAPSPSCSLLFYVAASIPRPLHVVFYPLPPLQRRCSRCIVRDVVDASRIRNDGAQPEPSRSPLLTLFARLARVEQRVGSRALAWPRHRGYLDSLAAAWSRLGHRLESPPSRAPTWPRLLCHLDSTAAAWSCPARHLESPPSPPRVSSTILTKNPVPSKENS